MKTKVKPEVNRKPAASKESQRLRDRLHQLKAMQGEYKQAEATMQQSRKLLKGVFTSQSDAIFVLDASNPPRIVDCNPAAIVIFGYSRREMMGKETDFLHVNEIELQKFRSFVYPAIEKKQVVHLPEFRMRRKDGTIFPTEHSITTLKDKQGNRIGWVSLVRDITERKQAEQALRESEQKYRALAENSLTGISIMQDNRFLYANNRFAQMHGYTLEEMSKIDIMSLLHPDDREISRERISKNLAGKTPDLPVIRHALKRDGQGFWVEVMATRIIHRGKPAIMANLIDITERILAEEELRKYRQHLEELVRQRTAEVETANEQLQQELAEHRLAEEKLSASLREKEMLLREIHHRVKNNLQLISSLLNLQSRHANNQQTSRALEDSLHRIRAMAIIHEELYKSKNLARINLTNYLGSLAANLFHAFVPKPDDIAFKIDAPKNILVGIDTAIPCGLIINELVSNSLKHAFPAGRKGQIGLSLQQEGDRLTITVSDNGIGLSADLDVGNPPSLGLRLVNDLVQQLEGTLELDRGTGTSFTITIYGGGK